MNDKQSLLPSEYSAKYKTYNSFSSGLCSNPISVYADNFNKDKLMTTKYGATKNFKPHVRKINYPYVKDDIGTILTYSKTAIKERKYVRIKLNLFFNEIL